MKNYIEGLISSTEEDQTKKKNERNVSDSKQV